MAHNIPQNNQRADSTLCLDNISLRCYSDYVYEGEADGGDKSPEKYMVASAPGKYINSFATVVGNSYRGADVETLQEKADELNNVIRLQQNYYGTIKTNSEIYTNGYEFVPTEESYGANIVYDENTGSARKTSNPTDTQNQINTFIGRFSYFSFSARIMSFDMLSYSVCPSPTESPSRLRRTRRNR